MNSPPAPITDPDKRLTREMSGSLSQFDTHTSCVCRPVILKSEDCHSRDADRTE